MILAIDYDGTIADTNAEKVKWIQSNLSREISSWHCNRTECVPMIGETAYKQMGDHVYERESTLQAPEVPGAIAALHALAASNELHVVTARPPHRIAIAREWLTQQDVLHLFTGIHSAHETPKSDTCRQIGAHILIDDDARHLAKVDLPGLSRMLLQSGRDDIPTLAEGVSFFSSWQKIVECIEGIG